MNISKGEVGTVVVPATSDGADKADRVLVDFGEGKGQLNCLAKKGVALVEEGRPREHPLGQRIDEHQQRRCRHSRRQGKSGGADEADCVLVDFGEGNGLRNVFSKTHAGNESHSCQGVGAFGTNARG